MAQAIDNLSRRALISSIAALPVAVVPATPTSASPDGELLALWQELSAVHATLAEMEDENSTKSEAYNARRLPMPDTCAPHPGDIDLFGYQFARGERQGYLAEFQINVVRPLVEEERAREVEGLTAAQRVWCSRLLERGTAIIEAYDAWHAADRALRAELDYRDNDPEFERLVCLSCELEHKIMLVPATTTEDLVIKARAALLFEENDSEDDDCDDFDANRVLRRLARDILTVQRTA